MSAVRTSLVKRRHPYTGEDVPWDMDTEDVGTSTLFRLLRGGGVRAFGSTSAEAALSRRQTRFLWVSAAFAAVWMIFWFI